MAEQVVLWALIVATAAAIGATALCYLVWPALGVAAALAVRAGCALAAVVALVHPHTAPRSRPCRPRVRT